MVLNTRSGTRGIEAVEHIKIRGSGKLQAKKAQGAQAESMEGMDAESPRRGEEEWMRMMGDGVSESVVSLRRGVGILPRPQKIPSDSHMTIP